MMRNQQSFRYWLAEQVAKEAFYATKWKPSMDKKTGDLEVHLSTII
jgi:hypothetical protein